MLHVQPPSLTAHQAWSRAIPVLYYDCAMKSNITRVRYRNEATTLCVPRDQATFTRIQVVQVCSKEAMVEICKTTPRYSSEKHDISGHTTGEI